MEQQKMETGNKTKRGRKKKTKCSFCPTKLSPEELNEVPFKASEHSTETILKLCGDCMMNFIAQQSATTPATETKEQEVKWDGPEYEEYLKGVEKNKKKNRANYSKAKEKIKELDCLHLGKSYQEGGTFCRDCNQYLGKTPKK